MEEHPKEALAERLVETYSDQLLRPAYSILNSVPDAQDVCQEVLVLYYYLGYDTNEIGALLGLRPGAVRARMKRARQKLKTELEGQGYDAISE